MQTLITVRQKLEWFIACSLFQKNSLKTHIFQWVGAINTTLTERAQKKMYFFLTYDVRIDPSPYCSFSKSNVLRIVFIVHDILPWWWCCIIKWRSRVSNRDSWFFHCGNTTPTGNDVKRVEKKYGTTSVRTSRLSRFKFCVKITFTT